MSGLKVHEIFFVFFWLTKKMLDISSQQLVRNLPLCRTSLAKFIKMPRKSCSYRVAACWILFHLATLETTVQGKQVVRVRGRPRGGSEDQKFTVFSAVPDSTEASVASTPVKGECPEKEGLQVRHNKHQDRAAVCLHYGRSFRAQGGLTDLVSASPVFSVNCPDQMCGCEVVVVVMG